MRPAPVLEPGLSLKFFCFRDNSDNGPDFSIWQEYTNFGQEARIYGGYSARNLVA
jgi:hypothetical protein